LTQLLILIKPLLASFDKMNIIAFKATPVKSGGCRKRKKQN
jgi:hypothetical protein